MDHPVVSLLNTGLEAPDPLESALGAARWWARVQHAMPDAAFAGEGKPRFDAALAQALRALRASIIEVVAGGRATLHFTGVPATDALLFRLALQASAVLEQGGGRLKRCMHGACERFFLDGTKNGGQRWCTLRCMERARAPRRRTIAR